MLVRNPARARLRRAGVVLAVLGTLAFVGELSACDGQATRVSDPEAKLKTIQIPVEGMSCAACAARVKKALTSMGGVSDVEVSLAERRVRIRFDPSRLSPDELVVAIRDLGYQAGAVADAR